jgi:predicted GIY-YIG superfamily endonuclease
MSEIVKNLKYLRYTDNSGLSAIMYFTYILKSRDSDHFYIGHTADLEKRLLEQNSGRIKSIDEISNQPLVFTANEFAYNDIVYMLMVS